MAEVITAVYEKGVLRPLEPLDLQEAQTVRIQVLAANVTNDEVAAALQVLVSAGLMRPQPDRTPPPDPVSPEERRRLAELLGRAPGKPLSEIVIEDRGEW